MAAKKEIPTRCRMCDHGCGILVTVGKKDPEALLEIYPDTAAALGVSDFDRVEVITETGTIRINARLCETIRPGTLHMAQGWESSNANRLTSVKHSDPISGFPNLKSLRCRIRKYPENETIRTLHKAVS